MKILQFSAVVSLAGIVAFPSPAPAQEAVTDPVGVVSFHLPSGSDTIVAPPLDKPPKFSGTPTSTSGHTINFGPDVLLGDLTSKAHYIQPKTGNQAGFIFDIESNTSNSITLVDNGILPSGINSDTPIKIQEYWTVGELFPPSQQNISFTPSSNTLLLNRRTQILLPNVTGSGLNRAPNTSLFFVSNTFWRTTSATGVNANDTVIPPDSYLIVRNPLSAQSGALSISGSVSTNSTVVQLDRLLSGSNDNYVSYNRPVDVKLRDLGLIDSGAFVPSAGTTLVARRDQLLLFDNQTLGINKVPSKVYFYFDNGIIRQWRSTSATTVDASDDIIPAGSGFVIRKFNSNPPTSHFWRHNLTLASQ